MGSSLQRGCFSGMVIFEITLVGVRSAALGYFELLAKPHIHTTLFACGLQFC